MGSSSSQSSLSSEELLRNKNAVAPELSNLIILTKTGDYEAFIGAFDSCLKKRKAKDIITTLKQRSNFDIASEVCKNGSFEIYEYLKKNNKVDFQLAADHLGKP